MKKKADWIVYKSAFLHSVVDFMLRDALWITYSKWKITRPT